MGVGTAGKTDTLFVGQRSEVNNVNTALLPATFQLTQTSLLLPHPSGAALAAC